MSGQIDPEMQRNDDCKRRYAEMIQKVRNNAGAPSTSGSMYESRLGAVNNTINQPNRTLTAQQFFHHGSNPCSNRPNQLQSAELESNFGFGASTATFSVTPTETQVFKMPQTVSQFTVWSLFKTRIKSIMEGLRQLDNKDNLNLLVILLEEATDLMRFPPSDFPSNPSMQIEYIANYVKGVYYFNHIPETISAGPASVFSEQSCRNNMYINNVVPVSSSGDRTNFSQFMHANTVVPVSSSLGERTNNSQFIHINNLAPVSSMGDGANTSQFTYANNNVVPLSSLGDRNTSQFMQPTVLLSNLNQARQSQMNQMPLPPANSSQDAPQDVLAKSAVSKKRGRPSLSNAKNTNQQIEISRTIDDSTLISGFFDDSYIAQRRDENVVKQSNTNDTIRATHNKNSKVKNTPKPKVLNNTRFKKSTFEKASKVDLSIAAQESQNPKLVNTSDLPKGAKAQSRKGRLIRSPVKYWKGYDSTINQEREFLEDQEKKGDLDISMTLRSNRVVKKTPSSTNVSGSKKDTPLATISENDNRPVVTKKPQTKKQVAKQDKENVSVNKKKPAAKKQNDKGDKKQPTATSKGAKSKKNETKQKATEAPPKEKETKNVTKKRKSKDSDDSAAKKKKVEGKPLLSDSLRECYSEDDELFGPINYRKPNKTMAVSPSDGLRSIKKAAVQSLSKETPPCKTLGQLVNLSGYSVTSSIGQEAPITKPNHVVKRVTKMVEKEKKEVMKKMKTNKNSQEQKKTTQKVLASYTTATPLINASVLLRANVPDSDDDESYDEDDNEDEDGDLL